MMANKKFECPVCYGYGEVEFWSYHQSDFIAEQCPVCRGAGEVNREDALQSQHEEWMTRYELNRYFDDMEQKYRENAKYIVADESIVDNLEYFNTFMEAFIYLQSLGYGWIMYIDPYGDFMIEDVPGYKVAWIAL